MQQGLIRYHLDQLNGAKLAKWMSTFWGLTPKGRQYVVEHKLNQPHFTFSMPNEGPKA
jgi:hypothetical protein